MASSWNFSQCVNGLHSCRLLGTKVQLSSALALLYASTLKERRGRGGKGKRKGKKGGGGGGRTKKKKEVGGGRKSVPTTKLNPWPSGSEAKTQTTSPNMCSLLLCVCLKKSMQPYKKLVPDQQKVVPRDHVQPPQTTTQSIED